jgi:uroporphyrinogen III methyltransferase/synthase
MTEKVRDKSSGVVYLVGAGPGDPALITVRGAKLLAAADVVVYDYLSNPQLLSHAPQAELIYVGKKAASHSMTQEEINNLLIDRAKQGQRVVRLKGGDPFVFGRGGEECEALHAAGIRFEVTPGVTAAIAAPAYAGIPVTHRDLNSSFTFITGHEKEEQYQDPQAKLRDPGAAASDLDWNALAKLPCLAFYMGVKSLPRICGKLIEHGMSATMSVAVIQWGTMPSQRTIVGTLENIAARAAEAKLSPPAMIIVGQVVSLRETLNWFETRPLFGQTIVVTRTRQQASELSERLIELGARVIEAPTIELHPSANWSKVDSALHNLSRYDWIIFTSANGLRFTKQRMTELGLDARSFGQAAIAAIGAATASAVRLELFVKVDLTPESFVAEALADALQLKDQIKGRRFLLLRADIARPLLAQRLQQGGAAQVDDVPIYETKPATALSEELIQAIDAKEVTWITFTSSSTAKNFASLLGDLRRIDGVKIASIGPITTQTLNELNLPPTVQADTFDIPGLINALVNNLR